MSQQQSQSLTNSTTRVHAAAPPSHDLLANYHPPSNTYDEIFARNGEPRRHWRKFLVELNRLGHDEFARRWEQSRQIVHENGIAYSAYGDPKDRPRPWELDPLPLLIPKAEWQKVAAGLRQRARVLELVLADLYGPQRLITQGVLPAEAIFAHPGFRRPYRDAPPAGSRFVHMYAADLARGSDGRWWVLADRTESPSGAGFALENRVVISRMLPTIFRDANVQRLASYFITLQDTVQQLAMHHHDNPRVVLLSLGPTSKNYFEDAYLARYLGYTLVEGDDLAVRNNDVMLKTLNGLLPVDVILRRPNSESCDPLELDGHGQLGSAGLLQAVRTGSVAVANAFGSGLVESPIFMAFLPQLCQRLLGEPLATPGVATWWCGNPESLDFVLSRIDTLTIKRTFRRRGSGGDETWELSRLPPDELAARVRANPREYVAQERIARSTIPRWHNGTFEVSRVALRSYVVSSDDGYEVLTGGLARTSSSTDSLEMSLVAGEGSKDTWILSDEPVEQVTLLPTRGESLKLMRSTGDLPSRVADNLYWLGRHLERADSAARLLRRVALRMTNESGSAKYADLPYLIRCLAEQGQIEPGYAVEGIKDQMPEIEQTLAATVFDRQQVGSLRSILDETFRIASSVRDRLSVDSWRIVVHLDSDFQPPITGECELSDVVHLANELIIDLAAFGGIVTESMTRTHGYRFLEIGRRLERSLQILMLLNDCFIDVQHVSHELLESVLEIADSRMTYRSRYLANLQISAVLDLLLTDDTNPRALAYQLDALQNHVMSLPHLSTAPGYTPDQRLAMSMLHEIRMTDIESLCEAYALGDQRPLQSLLTDFSQQLPTLSNAISLRYLVHAGPSQQLGDLMPQPK